MIACALGSLVAGIPAAMPIGRRVSARAMGWFLAAAPLAAFAALAAQMPAVLNGQILAWTVDWMPTLGVQAALRLDGLSLLFALLVSGIGALVLLYAGYYFAPAHHHAPHDPAQSSNPKSQIQNPKSQDSRFFLYLLLAVAVWRCWPGWCLWQP